MAGFMINFQKILRIDFLQKMKASVVLTLYNCYDFEET